MKCSVKKEYNILIKPHWLSDTGNISIETCKSDKQTRATNLLFSSDLQFSREILPVSESQLGDNCIQNVHLGRYIVGYMIGNFVLWRRVSGAVNRNFRPYKRWYTSPNEHFEYGYPHSNALFNIYSSKAQHFASNWSFVSNVKQHKRHPLWRRCYDGIPQNKTTQILDVIQSDGFTELAGLWH